MLNYINLFLSVLLGAFVGWERQTNHSAGIRTFALISLGSCLAMILSTGLYSGDPGRIAAQVISGIGFLGAGIILHYEDKIYGLTTAATIWITAIIGLAVGTNKVKEAMIVTILTLIILKLNNEKIRKISK